MTENIERHNNFTAINTNNSGIKTKNTTTIRNTQIYGLDESIYRSGYPKLAQAPTADEFEHNIRCIRKARLNAEYDNQHIKRAIRLAQAKGGGHNQFLTGIVAMADITLSNKCWVEAERYTFLNFISSMSLMHKAAHYNINDCCNEYVNSEIIDIIRGLQEIYNGIDAELEPEKKRIAYLNLLYNMPSGFELTAAMVTNYRCLKNIYAQRKNHRLPDWRIVCDWIEGLPMAKELIMGGGNE